MILLIVGLLALSFSTLKQIQEEWKTRGLTDTSYSALTGLILGGLVPVWAYLSDLPIYIPVLTAIGPVIGMAMVYLKMKDLFNTTRRRTTRRK